MKSLFPLVGFGAALSLTLAGLAQPSQSVSLVPLPDQSVYPDAAAADAFSFACAADAGPLPAFFAERQLPYDAELVHPWKGQAACHIYYAPTLKGFRASRDNAKIRALYAPIHPLNFLADSEMPGGNLEIVKAVISKLPRPAVVRLGVAGNLSPELWPAAAERNFPSTMHDVEFYKSGTEELHPWAQDQMKAGYVDGRLRVLVPRELFEGRWEDAALTRPLLANLQLQGFVQSKLAWEGGGLQFVASPKDPSKTIMAVGLRRYWGTDLTEAERLYVLRVEFGADVVLNLNETGVHADYAVSFLPQDDTALVAEVVRDNADLARAAAFALFHTFGEEIPPEVRRLTSLLAQWSGTLADRPAPITFAIDAARNALEKAVPAREAELDALVDRYVAANCPGRAEACFVAEEEMLRKDPELVRRTSTFALAVTATAELRDTLLGIVDAQMEAGPSPLKPKLDETAQRLETLGFRTVRVPLLGSGRYHPVGYANTLLFDRRLFVPMLGLGRFEERLIDRLRNDLKGQYEIIPVDARRVLPLNGGLHCVFGIIREDERHGR